MPVADAEGAEKGSSSVADVVSNPLKMSRIRDEIAAQLAAEMKTVQVDTEKTL